MYQGEGKPTTTLNVGCGSDPWGDVRTDFTRKPRDFYLLSEASTANVIADVTRLPFVDKCFRETRCYQVLEHVPDWRQALKEIGRVSKKVDIMVPCVSHIAKNEPMFIITGAVDYAFSKIQSDYTPKVKSSALGMRNLDYFRRLPERCREHLWQFNVNSLKEELHKMKFRKVNVETTYHDLMRALKWKDSWRIIAY